MKVYCKNCKYDNFFFITENCWKFIITHYNKFTGKREVKDILFSNNGFGGCEYYKRKWYKFWIKDK